MRSRAVVVHQPPFAVDLESVVTVDWTALANAARNFIKLEEERAGADSARQGGRDSVPRVDGSSREDLEALLIEAIGSDPVPLSIRDHPEIRAEFRTVEDRDGLVERISNALLEAGWHGLERPTGECS